VPINETGQNNILFQNNGEFVITQWTHPMFVILPALSDLMVTVYDSAGDE
jgi:hypothetical protein